MAAGKGKGDINSSSILSSAYFQPRIVDVYLASTLEASDFPQEAIRDLQKYIAKKKDADDESNIQKAQEYFESLFKSLSIDQRTALKEAIKALSSNLTLASSSSSTSTTTTTSISISKSSDFLQNDDQRSIQKHASYMLQNRILLGYCKMLDKKWIEAVMELDLVRTQLYSSQEDVLIQFKAIYLESLAGLQLASLLLGKRNDAMRFAKWRLLAI